MADASRLVSAMQRAAKPKENDVVDIVTGTVISINPLKIKIDKLELTESFLILSALCKETKIKIPEPDKNLHLHSVPQHSTQPTTVGDHGSHTHTISAFNTGEALPDILLWRGLQVGDNVYMIRCCQGQKYYVLQRKEGIT